MWRIIVAALVFGLCFLADKGFQKIFRSKQVYKSGKSVRLNRRTAGFGIVLTAIGIATVLAGISGGWLYFAVGGVVIVFGLILTVRYLSFGVFYDDERFLVTGFLKSSAQYRYCDITAQQLYQSGAVLTVELYLADSQTVMLQSNMPGMDAFMDHAFACWLRQTGKRQEDCAFYDPQNSCWFPGVEG